MRVLDLTQPDVRKAVAETMDIVDLYRSKLASEYQ